ncbi:CRISPR system precrRNA processing endoribonuclease RAMP protein Cas6 [Caldicellulosiruptor acetigenus]|uniref:CRISPR-associated protein Cas6 C-terminal domain-containing protein n=1 Tax=Caldicellulosiruptor acetigenus 6A TaxID=632516 RepID=G2PT68_9FIRM|nr:CRISPR system precrRNA processing endoribonuclease RAMP protein Cas6 [Caldicellulosiruptor acetigenus]AEM74227.1 Protein of unknown function DUF2276 [Caldicellulosiruptor acetigenus 6A]
MKYKKIRIVFEIELLKQLRKDEQQNSPMKIFGASFDLFLKLCAIFFDKDYVNRLHKKAAESMSFSPAYIDFKNKKLWFELNFWDDFVHIAIFDLKHRLIGYPNPSLTYSLFGISSKLIFSEYIENSPTCFEIDIQLLNQKLEKKCKTLNKYTIKFNTPFFIKLNDFNYSFPEKEIVINSLLKNCSFSDTDTLRQNLTKILPVNFEVRLEKVQYSQQSMHGCVGYITYNISNLPEDAKILLTKALIISSFRGIGAKRVQGFGNISVFLDGQDVNSFLSDYVNSSKGEF